MTLPFIEKAREKSARKKREKKARENKNEIKRTVKTSNQLEKIISSMQADKEYKLDEIAEMVGLKPTRTRELAKLLVDDGVITESGSTKAKRYKKNL